MPVQLLASGSSEGPFGERGSNSHTLDHTAREEVIVSARSLVSAACKQELLKHMGLRIQLEAQAFLPIKTCDILGCDTRDCGCRFYLPVLL